MAFMGDRWWLDGGVGVVSVLVYMYMRFACWNLWLCMAQWWELSVPIRYFVDNMCFTAKSSSEILSEENSEPCVFAAPQGVWLLRNTPVGVRGIRDEGRC